MSSINTISIDKLTRLVGTAALPRPRRRSHRGRFRGRSPADPGLDAAPACRSFGLGAGVRRPLRRSSICQKGAQAQPGRGRLAPPRRHPADALEGGFEAWRKAKLPLVPTAKLPPRDAQGRTVWVTRARPKVDRIACPWLIRRFIDPRAVFLFVAPVGGARRSPSASTPRPFDIEGVFWSHRGETCTFDTMIEEFGLATEPLLQLATIVRGADTGRPDLAPQAAGLLAASLGLFAHVCATTSRSSRPAWRSTTRSIAGAATPPRRRTTGRCQEAGSLT